MFKVNNKDKKRPHWLCDDVIIANFEYISNLFPVSVFDFEQVNVFWELPETYIYRYLQNNPFLEIFPRKHQWWSSFSIINQCPILVK